MRHYLWLLPLVCFCLSCEKPAKNQPAETLSQEFPEELENASEDSLESPAASIPLAYQIIPGQRIGQITLGDSPGQVQANLGTPDAGNAAMGKSLSTWYSKGSGANRHQVNVYTVREKTGTPEETVGVRQVRITSPVFKLANEGLKVGSTLPQIRNQFPEVTAIAYYAPKGKPAVYIYDATGQGIAFEIAGPDSVCVGITIHPKNASATDTYLPVHPELVYLQRD
jgi:hypothetical protein